MSVLIISGSHRPNSQSLKMGNYIKRLIGENNEEVELIDLAEVDLPFWDEGFWDSKNDKWKKIWAPIGEKVKNADSFVFIAPEYGGMVPAKLKNFFLFLNPTIAGHKPALIVSVSASKGGSYPIAELRTSSYKNSKICYIPDHIIIQNVEDNFNWTNPSTQLDKYITTRLIFSLKVLNVYEENFKNIRDNDDIFDSKYSYGM